MTGRRPYEPSTIEERWQARWEREETFRALDDAASPKKYVLGMFPYPTADGPDLDHALGFVLTDTIARYERARGFNVLHPTGWDAFGLPAELDAEVQGLPPAEAVSRNIARFREVMKRLGLSIDWSREIDTTEPSYYRWTQWIFLRLLEEGLAYRADIPVNWCPALGTMLANEEVVDGKSERGGHPVERRTMRPWLLRITAFAERLLQGLEELDWPEHVKQMQREWIGPIPGAEVTFKVRGKGDFRVFTTRPEILFGVTFCVLDPEHPLVAQVTTPARHADVRRYVDRTRARSERERLARSDERTGVFTGGFATNPVNGEEVPIWIAESVLASYGTGAVMAAPGHDQRDWEFAHAFGLPIAEVVTGGDLAARAHEGDGTLVNSSFLNGMEIAAARERIVAWLSEEGYGRPQMRTRLTDWLFSRQRYWGEPIPVVFAGAGEPVPVPDGDLPVALPALPEGAAPPPGESPLAALPHWVMAEDPRTGEVARRETDTMPQWAGSSWYHLRFADPHAVDALASARRENLWLPVDVYVGRADHAVLHLLYARFWHKVLFDLGHVHTREPFRQFVAQGAVRVPTYRERDGAPYLPREALSFRDGVAVVAGSGRPAAVTHERISPAKHNAVDPTPFVERHGADALRLHLLASGPPSADRIWRDEAVAAAHDWLAAVWRTLLGDATTEPLALTEQPATNEDARLLHRTIAALTGHMEAHAFDAAVEALEGMLAAFAARRTPLPREMANAFLRMLEPIAPHLAEEAWTELGNVEPLSTRRWPTFDDDYVEDDR